ncbi:hypothetical protein FHG93_23745, partial [Salmonella enterica]|nr:hypothetical protein [Salmonella enterica]
HYFSRNTFLINCKGILSRSAEALSRRALLNKEIGGSDRYCRFSIGFPWQSKSLKSTSERQQ